MRFAEKAADIFVATVDKATTWYKIPEIRQFRIIEKKFLAAAGWFAVATAASFFGVIYAYMHMLHMGHDDKNMHMAMDDDANMHMVEGSTVALHVVHDHSFVDHRVYLEMNWY